MIDRRLAKTVGLLVLVATLSCLLFLACYLYDNKYTVRSSQAAGGVLHLSEEDLNTHPVRFLTNGWELYRNRLLAPEDFSHNETAADEIVFVGQYAGLEDRTKPSPHGSATYRLVMFLPSQPEKYTLELPEIYSAYRLYIGGMLIEQFGEPQSDGYFAQTGNSSVSVLAAGRLEIILAVSDYDHFYSGMVYPPAFGRSSEVSQYLHVRFALRTAICAIGLFTGALYLLLWLLINKSGQRPWLPLLYGLMCLCFVGYTGYPIWSTLMRSGMMKYSLENFSYCLMFLICALTLTRLCGLGGVGVKVYTIFAVLVCLCSIVLPFFNDTLWVLLSYSKLISAYVWISAIALTLGTIVGLRKGRSHSLIMMGGLIVFDCALAMDRIFPLYEPIYGGWFVETAGGILVLLMGIVAAVEIVSHYRTKIVLEERYHAVSDVLDLQRSQYPMLLEQINHAKTARHDLRHHIRYISAYVHGNDMDGLRNYLAQYTKTMPDSAPLSYSDNFLINALLLHYATVAKAQDTDVQVKIGFDDLSGLSEVDLCIIISNLLENALEACARLRDKRWITITITQYQSRLGIFVENSYDGIAQSEGGIYRSRKGQRTGIGIRSVMSAVERLNGTVDIGPNPQSRVFACQIVLAMEAPKPAQ